MGQNVLQFAVALDHCHKRLKFALGLCQVALRLNYLKEYGRVSARGRSQAHERAPEAGETMGLMTRSASTRGLPPRLIRPQLNDHLYHSGARPGKAGDTAGTLKLTQMNKDSFRFTSLNMADSRGRNTGRDELLQETTRGVCSHAEQQAPRRLRVHGK